PNISFIQHAVCADICVHSADSKLTAVKKEESTLEGTSVTLSYKYSASGVAADYFFWYRQFPGKPPEFLISHLRTGASMSNPVPGVSVNFIISDLLEETENVSVKHDKEKQEFHLQISSAAVTDSAVYYCAVTPTVTGNNKTLYKNLQ
uniref:Immunoglobulin V-set domain-containing protein n=1 Tax=Oryzias latipes TaxID=8090 RepID=A0A3B3H493_ORYLA